MRNAGLTFVSKPVDVTVERVDTAFTSRLRAGRAAAAAGGARRRPLRRGAATRCAMLEAEGQSGAALCGGHRALAVPAQPERVGQAHRRHLQRRRATSSASCRIPERAADRAARPRPDGRGFFTSMISSHQGAPPQGSQADEARRSQAGTRTNTSPERMPSCCASSGSGADGGRTRGGAKIALHEVPEGRLRSGEQRVPRGPDRDLPPLRRHVARCRASWRRWPHEDTARPCLTRCALRRASASLPRLRRSPAGTAVTGSGVASAAPRRSPFPGERPVTPEVVREHNLNELEYGRILEMLGRTPTLTELGVFSALWSEHCSLQALQAGPARRFPPPGRRWSRGRARTPACSGCPTAGRSPSRSSPTTIPPRSSPTRARRPASAAFCATCSPWARARSRVLNSLRFGPARTHPRNRYLFAGVVRGVGDYGNCVGVPTLGGEVDFAPGYTGNPLVNAMCVGLLREDGPDPRRRPRRGQRPALPSGARTGRDGIHGASFASEELSEKSEARRPQVQVGDPFTEKLLLEASLELITSGLIVAIQDMGAAGLTSSSAEMAARGGVGVEIDTGAGAHPRSGDDALRDPALRIAGADAGGRRSRRGSRTCRRSARSGS